MLQVLGVKAAMGFPLEYLLDHGMHRKKIKLLWNAVCPPMMAAFLSTLTQSSGANEDA